MRLATFDDKYVGVVQGDTIVDVTDAIPDVPGRTAMEALIATWPVASDRIAEAAETGQPRPLADVRLNAPVSRPSKIVAAPVNYVDHMNEMSEVIDISSLGVFLKAPSSVLDPDGTIRLPYHDRRFDHEAELGVVIGRRARNVGLEDALDHVFGYTCLLDITMRGGEDRSTRKSFDTFTPIGPWLVTPDEFGRPEDAHVEGRVNGVVRQSCPIGDLIWGVPKLIEYISSVMTLEPGDVIATGTPAGVGPIVDGDTVAVEISGIGVLTTSVSAAGAVACPTTGTGRGPVPPPAPAR
jgi:2-keto-4-pentenoate hydratase/2-oxohepta-3-ene-1,7-dioic acid hydratase in catechol pathway